METMYTPITDIRLRRTEYEVGLMAYIPKDGEPVWNKETSKLHIGDGSTAGGIMVNTDSSTQLHYIASTTNMDSYHRFPGDVLAGMFLRSGSSGTAIGDAAGGQGYMKYLDFYDMKPEYRRHQIEEHGGAENAVFFTDSDPFKYQGTTPTDFKTWDGTNYTGGTNGSFRLKALKYDTSSITDDMSSTGSTFALSVQWDVGDEIPVLAWTRLDGNSVSLDTIMHDILDHTSSDSEHFIYFDENGDCQTLSHAGATEGFALRVNSSNLLSFSKPGFNDLTGSLKIQEWNGKKYSGRHLVHNIADNSIFSPWGLSRWIYGNPSSGFPTTSGTKAGETTLWMYGTPENVSGDAPGEGSAPYFSGAHLKISSFNTNSPAGTNANDDTEYVWGTVTAIDNDDYTGHARITLESINSSTIKFKTKDFDYHIMGVFNAATTNVSAYDKPMDKNFVLYLGGAVPGVTANYYTHDYSNFSVYTRTSVNLQNNVFGSTSANSPDFEMDTFGSLQVKGVVIDDTNDGYDDYYQALPFSRVSVLNSLEGITYTASKNPVTPINVHGVYLKHVKKTTTNTALFGTYTFVQGIRIDEITHNKTNNTTPSVNAPLGRATGLDIGSIDSDAKAMGLYFGSINSDSDQDDTAYGGYFGTIYASRGHVSGFKFNDISGLGYSTGLHINNVESGSKYAAGIFIGDYTSSQANCSEYGLVITGDSAALPSDWTGVGSFVGRHAILTDASAGLVRFMGNMVAWGNTEFGDADNIGAKTFISYSASTFYSTCAFGDDVYTTQLNIFDTSTSGISFETAGASRELINVEQDAGYISGQIKFQNAQVAYPNMVVPPTGVSWSGTTGLLLDSSHGGLISIDPEHFLLGTTRAIENISPSSGHTINVGTKLIIVGSYDGHDTLGSSLNLTFVNKSGGDSADYDLRLTATWNPNSGHILELMLVEIYRSSEGDADSQTPLLRWIEVGRTSLPYAVLS